MPLVPYIPKKTLLHATCDTCPHHVYPTWIFALVDICETSIQTHTCTCSTACIRGGDDLGGALCEWASIIKRAWITHTHTHTKHIRFAHTLFRYVFFLVAVATHHSMKFVTLSIHRARATYAQVNDFVIVPTSIYGHTTTHAEPGDIKLHIHPAFRTHKFISVDIYWKAAPLAKTSSEPISILGQSRARAGRRKTIAFMFTSSCPNYRNRDIFVTKSRSSGPVLLHENNFNHKRGFRSRAECIVSIIVTYEMDKFDKLCTCIRVGGQQPTLVGCNALF